MEKTEDELLEYYRESLEKQRKQEGLRWNIKSL